MEYDKNLYKSKLIEVLRIFDKFCEDHNLRYSMAYGSLLGTIRHKGIIPWDDDVDVVMPRPDYDKFIELTKNIEFSGSKVLSPFHTKNYYLPFSKIIDNNTTIVERKRYANCPIGVFVDIFPLDGYDKEEKYPSSALAHYQKLLSDVSLKNNDIIIRKNLFITIRQMVIKFTTKLSSLYSKMEDSARNVDYDKASYSCVYWSVYKEKEVMPKEWFEEYIRLPFEDITVKCIKNWDCYLKQLYGDYMTPPPVEKQISHHYQYFVDLNKRWNVEDIKKMNLKEENNITYSYE